MLIVFPMGFIKNNHTSYQRFISMVILPQGDKRILKRNGSTATLEGTVEHRDLTIDITRRDQLIKSHLFNYIRFLT